MLSQKKLLNSKWTAVKPINKEKHFIIVELEYDEDFKVIHCIIEAVMSKRQQSLVWRELNDSGRWLAGWK